MIPDGRDAQVRQVRGPVRFSQTPARTQLSRAPGLGQHSLEVLKECGLDDLEISALVADGGTRAGGSAPD
jgi:alpha-methylacyl-CoA racemase